MQSSLPASALLADPARSISPQQRAMQLACIAALSLGLQHQAMAQTREGPQPAGTPVEWSLTSKSATKVKAGATVDLQLKGDVGEGWHVYGLEQAPRGPTPLLVKVDDTVGTLAKAPSGTAATKSFDPRFKLDTEYYSNDFTLTVPVTIGAGVAPGAQTLAVNVRYQTCTEETCQPPKLAKLSVPIEIVAAR